MSSDSFQYRAMFEYKQERGDDISLQPGDLLTVSKMALLASDYQEGDEKCPKGWLHGTNEHTKEKGNFPGTFVEYVGVVRTGLTSGKPWLRPVPPTPVGPQPPGAFASEGIYKTLYFLYKLNRLSFIIMICIYCIYRHRMKKILPHLCAIHNLTPSIFRARWLIIFSPHLD